jgi:nitroimidazol reductase NimA-like FMN-containing flavoprotein (pyridoxamine 5'-phosphate oxidase superfamily)
MTQTSEGALVDISAIECLALLKTQQVGRLGVNAEHYPLIFCVNYGLDGDVVVIRVHPGMMLTNADHANVTFEVDQIDPYSRTGWSVLVRGLAERVTDHHRQELVERTKTAGMEPWAPGEHGEWIRLIPHRVTGRRIVAGQLPPSFSDRAYL